MPNNNKAPTRFSSSRKDRDDSSASSHKYTSSSSSKDEKSTSSPSNLPNLVSLAHIDRRDQPTSNSLLGRLKSLRKGHHHSSNSKPPDLVSLANVDRKKSTSSSSSSSRPAPQLGGLFGANLAHLDHQNNSMTHASSSFSKLSPIKYDDSQEVLYPRLQEHSRLHSSSFKPVPSSYHTVSNMKEALELHDQRRKAYGSLSKSKTIQELTSLDKLDKHDSGSFNLLKSISMASTRPPASMGLQTKSYFTTEHDLEMALQQTNYDSLTPEKQTKQNEWAQSKMAVIALCPGGCGWQRIEGGYHCSAEIHYIPDWLLAEGRGGLMVTHVAENKLEGPFYGNKAKDSGDAGYWVRKESQRRRETPRGEQEAFMNRFEGYGRARAKEKREKKKKDQEELKFRMQNKYYYRDFS